MIRIIKKKFMSFYYEQYPVERARTFEISPALPANEMPDEERMLIMIARELRTMVVNQIQQEFGWSLNQTLDTVQGYLQMQNVEDDRHAHTEDLNLRDLNVESLLEIFQRVLQSGSNPDLSIYQVKWQYWINSASLNIGRGRLAVGAKVGTHGLSNKNLSVDIDGENIKLGCASVALFTFLVLKTDTYGTAMRKVIGVKNREKQMCLKIWELQNELEWGECVSVCRLKDFVQLKPEYRIVVLDLSQKCSDHWEFIGEEYVDDDDYSKTCFLYWCPKELHYYYLTGITTFVTSMNSSNSFCKACLCTFNRGNPRCKCTDEEGKAWRPNPNSKTCETCMKECKDIYKHKCYHANCVSCKIFVKNDDDTLLCHRCVIMDLKKKPNIFRFSDDGWVDKKRGGSKNLIVYDLESALVLKEHERGQRRDHHYETDDNDMFYTDGDTLKFYTVDRFNQEPNLVVWKDVFHGEAKVSKNIDDFVMDMLYGENEGNNVAIAHNAAGYDSRYINFYILR
jgi:hypothetical protein